MDMIVLGINAFHGDASACLVEDGKVLVAVAEERFTRNKHEGGIPREAIKWCASQIDKKIEHVAVSRNPALFRAKKVGALFSSPFLFNNTLKRLDNANRISCIGIEVERILGHKIFLHNIEHHLAHLAYTYVTSGFKESAILSVDGFGDFVSTAWGSGVKNSIKINKRVFFPHSLGIFYSSVTQFLGFTGYGEEYKVMALASYGSPRYVELFSKVIWPTKNGFKLSKKYFMHAKRGVDMTFGEGTPRVGTIYTKELEKMFGPARKKGETITERHYDIASSMQAVTTEMVLHLAKLAKADSTSENLAIAGGVGLNSVANGALLESGLFRNIWFPGAPADDGTAIGAAAYVAMNNGDDFVNQENRSPFLGPEFVEKISSFGGQQLQQEELLNKVVQMLSEGKIIGWFEGKMEFGPRALGHRSIIADPRKAEMRQKINTIVKKREDFRPFAPMVLLEDASRYFFIDQASPNMMTVVKVRDEWKSKLAAITHVDGTARVQTVTKELLPAITALLKKWRVASGMSVLLNTSFNENEPIVNTPQEAKNCFERTKMDALVLNDTLFIK